jgi:phosphotransferase system HPr (HPr) family protein
MNGESLQHTVTITNPQGFHMRPKAAFAQLAAGFQSNVSVSWAGRTANGKSMWDLMLVAADTGDQLTVAVDGPDAPAALTALVALLKAPTPEEESPPSPKSRKG